jgi:translin
MDETPLAEIIGSARTTLDEKYRARETALAHGRALTRTCANAIRAMHRGQFSEARTALNGARSETNRIAEALSAHPDLFFAGYVQDAHKELAEAENLFALIHGDPLPSAQSLGIETAAYLNGLAEAASEGRRFALDQLRRGDVNRAATMLESMDEILSGLTTLDYPDAVTSGLRRTCDALRSVVERTRGDVTMAALQERLLHAIPNNKGLPIQSPVSD